MQHVHSPGRQPLEPTQTMRPCLIGLTDRRSQDLFYVAGGQPCQAENHGIDTQRLPYLRPNVL